MQLWQQWTQLRSNNNCCSCRARLGKSSHADASQQHSTLLQSRQAAVQLGTHPGRAVHQHCVGGRLLGGTVQHGHCRQAGKVGRLLEASMK